MLEIVSRRRTMDDNAPHTHVETALLLLLSFLCMAQGLGVGMIARMKLNARLHDLPPKNHKGKTGSKPRIGKRLTSMEKRLSDPQFKWGKIVFSEWYGHTEKEMMI